MCWLSWLEPKNTTGLLIVASPFDDSKCVCLPQRRFLRTALARIQKEKVSELVASSQLPGTTTWLASKGSEVRVGRKDNIACRGSGYRCVGHCDRSPRWVVGARSQVRPSGDPLEATGLCFEVADSHDGSLLPLSPKAQKSALHRTRRGSQRHPGSGGGSVVPWAPCTRRSACAPHGRWQPPVRPAESPCPSEPTSRSPRRPRLLRWAGRRSPLRQELRSRHQRPNASRR